MARRLSRLAGGFSALALIFLMLGCGGGGSGSSTQLRVMAASPDAPTVQAVVDGTDLGGTLAYQANTGYQSAHSGSRSFVIEAVGTTTNLVPGIATLNLGSGTETTVILAGFSSSLQGMVLTDDNTSPTSNTVNIRLVNAMPSLGAVDVYVVAPGTNLSSATPAVSNLGFAQASTYLNFPVSSGTNYEIYYTQVGTTFTYMDTGPIGFSTGQNRTVVGLNSTSGGSYTFAVLKDLN